MAKYQKYGRIVRHKNTRPWRLKGDKRTESDRGKPRRIEPIFDFAKKAYKGLSSVAPTMEETRDNEP